MTKKFQKIAFLFPGQGAQYPGMAEDFFHTFSAARLTFEEADDLLKRNLSGIILKGPEEVLTQTRNSQTGIYVASMAILRVIQELEEWVPFVCCGLSLGEYTALTAAERISFREALPLVDHRGQFMHEACERARGTMVAIVGLEHATAEKIVREVNRPHDLWIANFNSPGQVVLSGTSQGIEAGILVAKAAGAKKVIPLQVQGAFHSGLMKRAQEKLAPHLEKSALRKGTAQLVMNVPGDFVDEVEKVRTYLIEQVTHPVRWEQGIRKIEERGVDLYLEFGPGKTLAGLNKRIGVQAPTFSIEKVEDLDRLAELVKKGVER